MGILFYKWLHLIGIATLFFALGSSLQAARLGTVKENNPWHKSNSLLHGVALLLLIVSGFGMLAKLSIHWPFPGWIFAKLFIWAFMGYAIAFYKKGSAFSGKARILLIALFVLAAGISLYK